MNAKVDANAPTAQPITQEWRPPARWPLWLAGILIMLAAGTAGFYSNRPLYRAQAVIRVTPAGWEWGQGMDADGARRGRGL
jgi:hypothetical protein